MNRKKRVATFLWALMVGGVFAPDQMAASTSSDTSGDTTGWPPIIPPTYATCPVCLVCPTPKTITKTVTVKVQDPMTTDQIIAAVTEFSDKDMDTLFAALSADSGQILQDLQKNKNLQLGDNAFLTNLSKALDDLDTLIVNTKKHFAQQPPKIINQVSAFLRSELITIIANV